MIHIMPGVKKKTSFKVEEFRVSLRKNERERIFNLGYYTWVEQQGIDLESFERRNDQKFWDNQLDQFINIDNEIDYFNNLMN